MALDLNLVYVLKGYAKKPIDLYEKTPYISMKKPLISMKKLVCNQYEKNTQKKLIWVELLIWGYVNTKSLRSPGVLLLQSVLPQSKGLMLFYWEK
jgi:hypothetical protein